MDEIDLDKLIAESENFQPDNTTGASGPSSTQAPRLRKIKRPKHPGKPISANMPEHTPNVKPARQQVFQNPYAEQNAYQGAYADTPKPHHDYPPQAGSYASSDSPNRSVASQPYVNPQISQGKQSAGYDQTQNHMPANPNRELMKPNQQAVFDNAYDQSALPSDAQTEEYDSYAYQQGGLVAQLDIKKLVAIASLCLCLGLLIGKFMFSSEQVVNNGLQGVVVNPEVPKGRTRCGVAEKSQGCVLYIMNPQRQDLSGRDFYDLASQLTGRQRFVIETGNMRYSTIKIKPGNIAQLNIPPLQ